MQQQQRTNNRNARGNDIHHHHKKSNDTHTSNGSYKVAPGEILANESFLYSQHPESRQLRRQLWPIMEHTMNSIANSVAAGATALRHIVGGSKSPSPPQMMRMRTIKNVYLTSPPLIMPTKPTTTITYKRQLKPHSPPMPAAIAIDQKPVRTISENYLLRFQQEPSYLIKTSKPSKSANPYADMGVTGYKHFEQTVLRELEQKEERKVEATMNSLTNGKHKLNKLEEQLIIGNPYTGDGGWTPVRPSVKPSRAVGKLHIKTSDLDVKPVHEEPQESKGSPPKMMVSGGDLVKNALAPIDAKHTELRTTGFNAAASEISVASTNAPIVVADMPNYPEFYLKWANKLVQAKEAKEKEEKGTKKKRKNRRPSSLDAVEGQGSLRSYVTLAPTTTNRNRPNSNSPRKHPTNGVTPTTTEASISNYQQASHVRGNVKFSNSFPL